VKLWSALLNELDGCLIVAGGVIIGVLIIGFMVGSDVVATVLGRVVVIGIWS
jgi:hypothetical protein